MVTADMKWPHVLIRPCMHATQNTKYMPARAGLDKRGIDGSAKSYNRCSPWEDIDCRTRYGPPYLHCFPYPQNTKEPTLFFKMTAALRPAIAGRHWNGTTIDTIARGSTWKSVERATQWILHGAGPAPTTLFQALPSAPESNRENRHREKLGN